MSKPTYQICDNLYDLFEIPVWLMATCFSKATFSASDKNLAFIGVSGRKATVTQPMTIVTKPRTTNIIPQSENDG
jgi:hypothetical protein